VQNVELKNAKTPFFNFKLSFFILIFAFYISNELFTIDIAPYLWENEAINYFLISNIQIWT
jgi:hypothetical protein